MKNLTILSDENYLLGYWKRVFEIAADNHTISTILLKEFDEKYLDSQEISSFIIVSDHMTVKDVTEILNLLLRKSIPVILSKRMSTITANELLKLGVVSIIEAGMSILTISHTLRIVESGGIILNN